MRTSLIATAAATILALVGGLAVSPPGYAHESEARYYDRDHRDYHHWNGNEDRVYRSYRDERHESYRDFRHTSRAHQQRYWNWRHEHPDSN